MLRHWGLNKIDEKEKIKFRRYLKFHDREEDEHTHDFIEIEYITHGEVTQVINGETIVGKPGDYFILYVGDRHGYSSDYGAELVNLMFYPELYNDVVGKDFYPNGRLKNHIHLSGKENKKLMRVLRMMEDEYLSKRDNYIYMLKNYLHIVLVTLLRSGEVQIKENLPMSDVLEYIEKEIETVTISKIGEKFGYNKAYFARKFKEYMQISLLEYINRCKILEAVRLIKEMDMPAEKVCTRLGFANKTHFYELFKRYTNFLPSDLRERKR